LSTECAPPFCLSPFLFSSPFFFFPFFPPFLSFLSGAFHRQIFRQCLFPFQSSEARVKGSRHRLTIVPAAALSFLSFSFLFPVPCAARCPVATMSALLEKRGPGAQHRRPPRSLFPFFSCFFFFYFAVFWAPAAFRGETEGTVIRPSPSPSSFFILFFFMSPAAVGRFLQGKTKITSTSNPFPSSPFFPPFPPLSALPLF